MVQKVKQYQTGNGEDDQRSSPCSCFHWLAWCGAYGFFSLGQTFNKEYDLNVRRRLLKAYFKWPELWAINSWFIHNDIVHVIAYSRGFCQKVGFISFRNRNICLIWLRATSGYSSNSKDQCEDTDLRRLKDKNLIKN